MLETVFTLRFRQTRRCGGFKVYVGANAGQGALHASLSDFSALDYDDVSMSSVFDLENGVYTINYQAGFGGANAIGGLHQL
jgi:hypothetical protein